MVMKKTSSPIDKLPDSLKIVTSETNSEFNDSDRLGVIGFEDSTIKWLLGKARNGDIYATRHLYHKFAEMMLCRDGIDISPFSRRVLAKLFMQLCHGKKDPLVVMHLKPTRGNKRWMHIGQQVAIIGHMISLIEPGSSDDKNAPQNQPMDEKDAAIIVANSGEHKKQTSTGPKPVTAKWILNLWYVYKKDPDGFIPE